MPARPATFLDANAGAPLRTEVREALLPFLAFLPNPSSIHSHGRKAKRALTEARERVARSLGPKTDAEQLIFTSGATEANQLAIRSGLGGRVAGAHWILTPVEHDSVLSMVNWFKARGGEVSFLSVDESGAPLAGSLEALIRPQTALVSVLWVNNETGVISNISEFSRIARTRGIPLHVDAAQAWGKLPIDVVALGASYVTVSGHKIGSLAGSGALYVGRGVPVIAAIPGKQEKGRRGGTENGLGLISMGVAASLVNPASWSDSLTPLRDRLEREVRARISGVTVNGAGAPRVGNTINLSFEGVEGDGLVMALDLAGFSVSSGSACSSGVLEPSHVLLALGRTRAQATAAVRISLPGEVSWEELENFVDALDAAVARVRTSRSAYL
ncbi:MAG: cysteine desulfurase family protein [Bdellovibrionota bacterium]